VISKTRPAFWRAYGPLPSSVKARAREIYRLFAQNPDHPSLRFKKLQGRKMSGQSASMINTVLSECAAVT